MNFESIEQANEALDLEMQEWARAGLNMNNLQLGALAPMLLDLSTRIQALTNILLLTETFTEDELNLEFKTILYNNLVALRETAPQQERDAIRKQIIDGARVRLNGGKLPWER